MSYTDEFLRAMLKDSANGSTIRTPKTTTTTTKTTKKKKERQLLKEFNSDDEYTKDFINSMGDDDVAPVRSVFDNVVQRGTEKSVASDLGLDEMDSRLDRINKGKVEEEEESRLDFFQKGAFEDGYQFGDVTKTILGTAGDAGLGILKGTAKLGEGIGDLISYGVAGVADLTGNDEFADRVKRNASRSAIDELTKGADDYLDRYSILGRTSDAIMEGIGQVGGIMATGGVAGAAGVSGAGLTALTTGMMGVSGMGSGIGEAYEGDATDGEAVVYGLISGASDALTELMFGGLGKSVNALGFNKGLLPLDDLAAKKVSSMFSNQIAKNFAEFGIKATAEGVEEWTAGIAQAIGKKITYMSEEELGKLLADENLLEQFVVGAVTSGIVQSPSLNVANKAKTDFVTGNTEIDQKVVDRLYNDLIANEEKAGSVSSKRKTEIYNEVLEQMEKGYIPTEVIEEALGGENYKAYQDTIESENKALAELAELYEGEELEQRAQEFMKSSKRGEAAKTLSDSVYDMVKDSKLGESYRERSRRYHQYTADVSKYDEKQKATIQRAIDSGVLNNTNRTHDLVDWIARVSSDTGVPFDFTNNKKLSESIFAVDGRTVNGFRTADGITINVQSPKYINSIVGHEMTHVLEDTKLYEQLEKIAFDFAKEQGIYKDALKSAYEMYHGVEGYEGYEGLKKIKKEAVADLVGDYLFTDQQFVNNLAKHKNIFQKMYDEIKYLVSVATAGSDQKKKLLQVQRSFEQAFENAYKATGNASAVVNSKGDVQHSLSNETEKVSYPDILKNLGNYSYSELQSIADQLSNGEYKIAKNMPRSSLETVLRETISLADEDIPTIYLPTKGKQAQSRVGNTMTDGVNTDTVGQSSNVTTEGRKDQIELRLRELHREIGDRNLSMNNTAQYVNGIEKLWSQLGSGEITDSQYNEQLSRRSPYYRNLYNQQQALEKEFDQLVKELEGIEGKEWKQLRSRVLYGVTKKGDAQYSFSDKDGNTARFKGRPFWSGSVSLLDGVIEEVHSRKDAEAADYHHSMYFSPGQVEKMANGENAFFWVDRGEVQGEWRDSISKDIKDSIEKQIVKFSLSKDSDGKQLSDRVFYTPRGVEVVQNPTNAEYRQMREEIYRAYPWLRGTGEAILRHTYDEAGNEYYWNAFDGMHRDVEPYINKQYNTRTSQHWEWWTREDKDDYPADYSHIRFSLSKSVEETKDLMALHNLHSSELLKQLEMGGMPYPSVAITNPAKIKHEDFGEISVVLHKDAIDPKKSKYNHIYSSDAYTPTFPHVSYEASREAADRVIQKVGNQFSKIPDYYQRSVRSLRDFTNLNDYLNRWGGEQGLFNSFVDDHGMKQIYLAEKGESVPVVIERKETQMTDYQKALYQTVIDRLGTSTLELLNDRGFHDTLGQARIAWTKEHIDDLKDIYAEDWSADGTMTKAEALDIANEQKLFYWYKEAVTALEYMENGGLTVEEKEDFNATNAKIDEKIAGSDYKEWLKDLFSGIEGRSGIRNNKDTFLSSGKRRSFSQLHDPVTIDNVIKAMRKKDQTGQGAFGTGNFGGASVQEYGTIAEAKRNADMLGVIDEAEYKDIKQRIDDRLFDISGRYAAGKDIIDAKTAIVEAVAKNESKAGIARYLKQYDYVFKYTDDIADDIIELRDYVRSLPRPYFEAKPRRAVGFDEVAAFVIPYDADVKLKQELLNRGYNIAEYDPKVEGDRQRVVNQFEEFKFSLSNVGDTPTEHGNWHISGKDIAYEDIAPVTVSETESVAPAVAENATTEELFPDEPTEYPALLDRKEALESRMMEAVGAEDFDTFNQINEEYESVMAQINEFEQDDQDRFSTLDDADAPPETEGPYYEHEETKLTQKATADIARNVRASLGLSNMQMADARSIIEKFRTGEIPDRDQLIGELRSKFGTYTEKGRDDLLAEIQSVLRSRRVNVPDYVRHGIPDYNQVRKKNFGKIRFSKEGLGVDEVYDELNDMYPSYFPADIDVPENQLRKMIEVANLSADTETRHDLDIGAIEEAADSIINGIYRFRRMESIKASERQAKDGFKSLMKEADLYAPPGEDIPPEKLKAIRAKAKLDKEYSQQREALKDKNAYISKRASELYDEIRNLKKGVRASDMLSALLDTGHEWSSIRAALVNIKYTPGERVNANSAIESIAREMLNEDYEDAVYSQEEEYRGQVKKIKDESQQKAEPQITRKVLHEGILDDIKAWFSANGFDFDTVLKNAKNLSTFATVDNIPQRVMEKALGYKEGGVLADTTVNKAAQHETKGIQWLNSYTDRKNGILSQLSNQYHIKPGSKESAAAQMYAEGFYVNGNNEIIQYGDAELALDFPDAKVRANIKGLAKDPRIRKIYDDTLAMINEARERNGYPPIPRLENYFLHFRAMEDTFSRLGLPFNPNDIKAKDLPTDLNGVTADLKPGQPYFASAMHRTGKRTSFDLLGGMERYLSSAKNQIYHIDDIQTLRALRNYIADTYGQAHGLESLDLLTEEEAQERIEKVYGSHLSTFAKFLNEEANILAGKTALIDRGLEGIIGRRGITFLDTVNKQVGSNMVGFNVSSSLTNFLPVAQTLAKTNKFDFLKAFAQTVSNKIGRGDGFAENSPVVIRRKGADRFYRTPYQKVGDAGYTLMSAVDDISTELIARTKYNELTRKGMDSQRAHIETDKWVSRLMGDRSLGQQPQLYNSRMLGLLTKFQLEVRNQLDSQFYDTIQEAKVSYEDVKNARARNAKIAAKVGSTFFQLAVAQHLFGKAFESVAGYNPAFDIISVISKAFGWDDEEDSEDTVLDNIEQGFLELLEDLPYTSTLTGGRIPISSALPIKELVTGEDQYGNEKSRLNTIGEVAPYYLLPGGYGQAKKTWQGLSMFSDEHPIAGSYTDKGNLRFPVDDTLGNRAQAAVFGQWANENARDYFDNERSPLNPNQTQEFIDVDLPIRDYWEYREGLSGLSSMEEKGDYIGGLDLPIGKQNILINNIADREEPIDMTNYSKYPNFKEFDYGEQNPEKYAFLQDHGMDYASYEALDEDSKAAYTWAFNNPEKYEFVKKEGYSCVEYHALDEDTKDAYSWAYSNPEKYEFIKDQGLSCVAYHSLDDDSKDAYTWAYNNPEGHIFSKAISNDVVEYRRVASEIYDIKADKDKNGKSISGTRKRKVIEYLNNLDADYGAKIILFKSEYPSDDSYNRDIVDYLNSRTDISWSDMVTILEKLGAKVSKDGRITW